MLLRHAGDSGGRDRPGGEEAHQADPLPEKLSAGTPWLDGVSHSCNGMFHVELPLQSSRESGSQDPGGQLRGVGIFE